MKRILALALAVLSVCLVLGACGGASVDTDNTNSLVEDTSSAPAEIEGNKLTAENVVGIAWQCTYHTDEGDKIYTRFWLYEDGTYKQLIAINELFDHHEYGAYDVAGEKLYLYLNGDLSAGVVYEYKNGNLINNGNEFTPYFE